MKKKIISCLICVYVVFIAFSTVYSSAYEPYTTYTYSKNGTLLYSPSAYTPGLSQSVDTAYMKESAPFRDFETILEPTDILAGPDGRVYIVDRKTSQVIILNSSYKAIACISTFDSSLKDADTFKSPEGVFVDEDTIYVCDTQNNRIVTFDAQTYEFKKIIGSPKSALLNQEKIYLPIAMAVDQYKRLFVLSRGNEEGIIVMDEDANFTGYIGAPAVQYSLIKMLWRRFQTEEQRKKEPLNVSTQLQNITVDSDGFIYATSFTIKAEDQFASLISKDAKNSPVRRLNSSGNEIMKRNGFFDCAGEVALMAEGVSKIVDVACGPEGSWSIIDTSRSRVYTYDSNGVLLFAFGDKGPQLGNLTAVQGITYQGTNMLLLDYATASFTVYTRTRYGDTLIAALQNENLRQYDRAIDFWLKVLQSNNNFDAAYIGVGKSLYNRGEYEEAMRYLESAYETKYYSKAYSDLRKVWTSKFLLLIPVIAVALLFGVSKWFKYAAKVNEKATLKVGRKTYWEELVFSFHLVFHPFDGFWDLKHEQRGSVRGAFTILGINILAFYYQSIGRGYLLNPEGLYQRFWVQIISIFVPVLLFITANWCLTTLFDGEGSFKDIFITTSYALAPVPIFIIVSTVASNFITETGVGFITFINAIGFVWAGLLLFFGMLVTHDYSMVKNILTIIFTIVSMAVIMFVAILFSNLIAKMIGFVASVVSEITYRM